MELYYKAYNRKGEVVRGRIVSNDKTEANRYLRQHDLFPIDIDHEKKNQFSAFVPFYKHGTGTDIIFFTRQLASMMQSGLTLMQGLNVLRNQVHDVYFSEILQGISGEIQDGHSFAQAIAQYPNMFSEVYIAMIRSGEKAGLLDKVLARLAINLEKAKELKDEVRAALVYPIIVIVIMIGVISIMLLVVVPQLAGLYKSLNVDLPLMTRIVVYLSDNLVAGLPFIIVGGIAFIIFFQRFYRTDKGKLLIDSHTIKIPLIGPIMEKSMFVEFTRTFSLLISTGNLVIDSLQQCAQVVGNAFYRDALNDVAKRVEKGITIGDAFAANDFFPSLIVEMTKIGEQTGKLDESLLRVSEYYEREVAQQIRALTSAIEPVILVVLGVTVGFLIIAIITPIYGLVNAIHS